MFASDKWETVRHIADRKHITMESAVDGIADEFMACQCICRFTEGVTGWLEFRLKK